MSLTSKQITSSSKAKQLIFIDEFNLDVKIWLKQISKRGRLNRHFKKKVIYLHLPTTNNDNQVLKKLFFEGVPALTAVDSPHVVKIYLINTECGPPVHWALSHYSLEKTSQQLRSLILLFRVVKHSFPFHLILTRKMTNRHSIQ